MRNVEWTQASETLNLNIERDPITGLPLLGERAKILDLVLAYLPLPYLVAEYGCGKKCHIILKKLVDLGLPAYSLKRGMIMERDMSEEALNEMDWSRRKYALIVENPLYHIADLRDQSLIGMLELEGIEVDMELKKIHLDTFGLSHDRLLQFKHSRSHIFPIITFWNEIAQMPVEAVIDPTIRPDALFKVPLIRQLLNSSEALIFAAPMLGRFHLDPKYMTKNQKWEMTRLAGLNQFNGKPRKRMDELVRNYSNASIFSIGNPANWSYANNFKDGEDYMFEIHKSNTGLGDPIGDLFDQLLKARIDQPSEALKYRDQLLALEAETGMHLKMKEDARWAEDSLEPLAVINQTISYHEAISKFDKILKSGDVYEILTHDEVIEQLFGIGHRLQQDLQKITVLSQNKEGEIDARAFNPQFNRATCALIQDMKRVGLKVFIDKVGNVHGLLMNKEMAEKFENGYCTLNEIAGNAICHCSHIDTVRDAGKYDGRLGVLSGIQVAGIFNVLDHFFGHSLCESFHRALMVSAYVGEEMTFTGEGVSMPGSAAVTGNASIDQIYSMNNAEGELFRDKLLVLLKKLSSMQEQGMIELENDFSKCIEDEDYLEACYEPTHFFTSHTYERHIEQGPVLDRLHLPIAIVEAIMGIHQEDLYIEGLRAEEAAMEMNLLMRDVAMKSFEGKLRITVGIMESTPDCRISKPISFAVCMNLEGSKNHAGATLMEDRRDPGLAAARLAYHFKTLIVKLNKDQKSKLVPAIGGINLFPGCERNVIPQKAMFMAGVYGDEIRHEDWQAIIGALQNFAVQQLSKEVTNGGEGLLNFRIENLNFMDLSNRMRVSIDMRAPSLEMGKQCLDQIDQIRGELEKKYNVSIRRSIEQDLEPFLLGDSGQVLQMERSYGGSHNPNEAALLKDLLRGTLLQIQVSLDFLQNQQLSCINLHQLASRYFPPEWNMKPGFVSGALHDTCNIAAKIQKSKLKIHSN